MQLQLPAQSCIEGQGTTEFNASERAWAHRGCCSCTASTVARLSPLSISGHCDHVLQCAPLQCDIVDKQVYKLYKKRYWQTPSVAQDFIRAWREAYQVLRCDSRHSVLDGVKLHAMAARNCFVVCYMSYSVCCMLAYADRARSLVLKAEGSNHCCDLAATQKLWPSPPRPSACCTLRFCCTLHLYVARCMWSAARPSVTRCLPSCSSACSSTRIRWVADCPFVARVARCILYLHIQCVLGSAHAARCGIGWC